MHTCRCAPRAMVENNVAKNMKAAAESVFDVMESYISDQ